jgi:hypothetical protein
MTSDIVLATTTNSLPIAILALFALGAAVLYSIRIAYTLFDGYRTATTSRAGYVAVGLLLLTTVPIVLRFVMATWGAFSVDAINVVTAGSQLLGLGAITVGIYTGGGR